MADRDRTDPRRTAEDLAILSRAIEDHSSQICDWLKNRSGETYKKVETIKRVGGVTYYATTEMRTS